MCSISFKDFLLWEKKQLSKGGDIQSLLHLYETVAEISRIDLNLLRLNPEGNIFIKNDLSYLERIWDDFIKESRPIQYLCGCAFWRNLDLHVSDRVLIPRPETELIIDIVLERFKDNSQKLIFADLGTGSGALSIALALVKPFWEGIATDIDQDAIDIASNNFIHLTNQSNLKFTCGHWWSPLEEYKGELDLAISNPPYIPLDIYKKLPKEVKNFEPKIALLGGEDGLDHIREIVKYAPIYLKEKGWLILENHFDQSIRVSQLFLEHGFTQVEVLKDLSGIGRFTIGRYK